MKKEINLIVLIIVFNLNTISAQANRFYKLKAETLLQECDKKGDSTGLGLKSLPNASKFTIVGISLDNTKYIIRFWRWSIPAIRDERNRIVGLNSDNLGNKERKQQDKISKYLNFNVREEVGKPDEMIYFLIDKGNLDFYASPILEKYSPVYGAAILPFKARLQDGFDFDKGLSISNLGGVRVRCKNSDSRSMLYVVGIGLTVVNLDSSNTKGRILTLDEKPAVSLSGGVIFEWHRLQIGLFSGFDFLAKRHRNDWISQGKPWLALGIGMSLFSEENLTKVETNNK